MSDSDKAAAKGKDTAKDEAAEPVVLSPKPASQVEGEQLGADTDEAMREADLSRYPGGEAAEHAAKAQAQHEKDNPPPDGETGKG